MNVKFLFLGFPFIDILFLIYLVRRLKWPYSLFLSIFSRCYDGYFLFLLLFAASINRSSLFVYILPVTKLPYQHNPQC